NIRWMVDNRYDQLLLIVDRVLVVRHVGVRFFVKRRLQPTSTLFPYTTLFRSLLMAASEERMPSPLENPNEATLPTRSMPQALVRSEEHTSELQSRFDLVCRLLLEKKKTASRATGLLARLALLVQHLDQRSHLG